MAASVLATWVCPIPKDRPDPPIQDRELGRANVYVYRTAAGDPAWVSLRWDTPTGKVIRPLTLWRKPDGSLIWERRFPPAPRALYNLDRLFKLPDAKVLVVEGEKAVEASSKLFPGWVVTTSGSATSAGSADWTSLMGREVAIWSDADDPGRRYAEEVRRYARAAGATKVGIVDLPPGLPDQWDLADLESTPISGLDAARALVLMEEALMEKLHRETGPAWKHPTLPVDENTSRVISPWVVGDVRRMLAEPPPPVEWLVEGLIPAGMPGILAGRANAGKSMLALEIGMCLAAGLSVLGRAVTPGAAQGVVFVGLEDDEPEFRRRMHRGLALLEEAREWSFACREALEAHLVPVFPNFESGASFSLKAQLKNIAEKAAAIPGGCGLIILDTLSRMAEGDENSAKDMRPFNEAASGLVQITGASVLSIHHVGKGNDTPSDKKLWERLHPEALRGSSAVEAAARWILQLAALSPAEALAANLDSSAAMNGSYVVLGLTKMNAAEKGSMVLLERRHSNEPGAGFLCPHPDSDRILAVIQGASAVLKLNKRDHVLLAIAEAGGNHTHLDKAKEAASVWPDSKDPRGQWDKALTELRQKGWLRDSTLTDIGWAKAATLGLPGGRKNPEEPEDIPSFPSAAVGEWNGRKEEAQEVVL